MAVDEQRLREFVRSNAERICQHFLPHGRKIGHEWRIGDSSGKAGNSLGIELVGPKAGLAIDRAGGFDGDLIKLIGQSRSLTYPLVTDEIGRTFGVSFQVVSQKPTIKPSRNGAFDWSSYVSNVTDADLDQLAKWRGYSPKFCRWLRDQKVIGRNKEDEWAFPVQYKKRIVAAHVRLNGPNAKGKFD
jgi:hypothetical protein